MSHTTLYPTLTPVPLPFSFLSLSVRRGYCYLGGAWDSTPVGDVGHQAGPPLWNWEFLVISGIRTEQPEGCLGIPQPVA